MKKIKMAVAMVLVMGAVVSVLSACGQTGNPEETQANGTDGVAEISDSADEAQETQNGEITDPVHHNSTESEDEGYMTTAKEDVLESLTGKYDDSADSETTAEELLDLFIDGSISAVDAADLTSAFHITDLNMDSEEWDSCHVGEKVDLDNDGENELIICGPYGGMYLDARDDRVYKFAEGGGTALILSYTCYNGDIWIMYSNRSSAGFEFYHMEKYEGADNLVAEMNFGEEFDIYHAEEEDGVKYTFNGAEISYDEYTALCSKIFAAEVSTN